MRYLLAVSLEIEPMIERAIGVMKLLNSRAGIIFEQLSLRVRVKELTSINTRLSQDGTKRA